MNANELMLGDWIATKSPMGVQNSLIQELYPKGIITETGGAFLFDEISAIPLTQEILEKNGFAQNYMYNVLKIDEDFEFWYYPHLGYLRYEYRGELLFKSMDGLNYVHQLQHALRFCGIEKEIIL